ALSRRNLLRTGGTFAAAAALMTDPFHQALAQNRGGHLIIGRSQGSDTMDNQKAALVASSEVQAHIYDPLAVIDPRTGVVHPSLAVSWEFVNDNRSIVFNLRPGVTFHDGTPFNAQAVEATVRRHLDPATGSPTRFILGPIESAVAEDEMTVIYNYTQPYVAVWVGFLIPYASPHSPTAVERYGDDFGRNPVGTGPFRFVSWDANDVITLERNPDRDWASPAYENPGAAWIDSAEYRTIPEAQTRVASLISGEIDLIAGSNAVPLESIRQLESTPGLRVVSQPALGSHGVVFSQNRPPMDDVRVRRAISHALEREKVLVFALDGNGQVATSPLASSYAQYDPATAEYGHSYDPDAARALLAEAGHGEGLQLTMLTLDSEIPRTLAEVLQGDLAAVGVELEIVSLPNAEYGAVRNQGEYDLVYMSYSYSDADIVNFLFAHGSALNLGNVENERLDQLVREQRTEFDPERRREMIHEVQRITVGEAYWLPVIEANIVAAMRDTVSINMTAAGTLILNDVQMES
ncbi:MAG: ABC transporter substrate-binding protein, partial [Azospirillaceae bacterium]